MPRNAPATPELRSYDPPWYDKAAYAVTDWLYGPNANAQQTGYVKNALGPDNPFNLPAQATRGVNTMSEGYRQGDYGKMAGGAVETAASAIPLGYGFGRMSNAIYDRMPANALGIFGGRLAKTADHAALAKAEEMTARGVPREQVWSDTGWFAGPDGKWRFEIDDSKSDLDLKGALGDGWQPSQKWPLDHLLSHKSLFSAYPDLAQTGIQYRAFPAGLDDAAAANSRTSNTISLNSRYRDFDDEGKMRSFGLHETQHGVQARERFAQGGSSRGFTPDEIAAERARLMAVQEDATGWGSVGTSSGDMPDLDVGRSLYRRLAGEVEARTVQKRMDMTADQRRARAPWLDYDVPEANQIIRNALGY